MAQQAKQGPREAFWPARSDDVTVRFRVAREIAAAESRGGGSCSPTDPGTAAPRVGGSRQWGWAPASP